MNIYMNLPVCIYPTIYMCISYYVLRHDTYWLFYMSWYVLGVPISLYVSMVSVYAQADMH